MSLADFIVGISLVICAYILVDALRSAFYRKEVPTDSDTPRPSESTATPASGEEVCASRSIVTLRSSQVDSVKPFHGK